jgi:hypothetical protein
MRAGHALMALAALSSTAAAQSAAPADDAPIVSMGQPPRWKPYLGAFAGVNGLSGSGQFGGLGLLGVQADLISPLVGVSFVGEAYAGTFGSDFNWGGRLAVAMQPVYLQPGIDWTHGDGRPAFILSLALPARRGGILGGGSLLRVDWIPSRNHTLNVGVTLPMLQRWAGHTRPHSTTVPLPGAPAARGHPVDTVSAVVARANVHLAEMRSVTAFLAGAFDAFYAARGESHAAALDSQRVVAQAYAARNTIRDSLRPSGRAFNMEFGVWHDQLRRAFEVAAGAPLGAELATAARRALLDSVLLPYNARFGQHKHPDQLQGLGAGARAAFAAVLPQAIAAHAEPVLAVFDSIVAILDEHRADLFSRNSHVSRAHQGVWARCVNL